MAKVNEERPGEHYHLGMKREEWVVQAAGAMIATTSPGLRYLLLRGGFHRFERMARIQFQESAAAITYTSTELRHIFHAVEWWAKVKTMEARLMWPRFEQRYEEMRRGEPWRAANMSRRAEMLEAMDAGVILTENANGQRRVH